MHGGDGSAGVGIVRADHASRPFAVDFDARRDSLGCDLCDVGGELLQDVVCILLGYQAHGDLCRALRRDHSFGSRGGEAADNAVDFQRRPCPGAIEHGVSGFASQHIRSDFVLAVFLFIERQTRPGFEFSISRLLHVIVEAGDEDVTVSVLELAQNLDQPEDGVGRGSAVHAGVQINLRPAHLDLGIEQAPKTDAQRRNFRCKELGVGDQRKVSLQLS